MSSKERIYYLDILKILSCLAVILMHVCDHSFQIALPFGLAWNSINVLDSVARFAVPIFFMISGALFLSREKIDLKRLYSKNILRLFTAYVFWIIFYSSWNFYWGHGKIAFENIGTILSDAVLTPMYHLWFVPTMIGVYVFIPILQNIIQNSNEKEMKYILKLFFVFCVVRCSVLIISNCVTEGFLKYLSAIFSRYSVDLFTGYVGYFFLGYYLSKFELKKKIRVILYILGIVSLLICIIGTAILSKVENKITAVTYFYEYRFITTLFTSVDLFIFGKYVISKMKLGDKAKKVTAELSNASFGIYLIHLAVLSRILPILLVPNVPISILTILTVLCTFTIALIIILLLRRIPVVGKYIT